MGEALGHVNLSIRAFSWSRTCVGGGLFYKLYYNDRPVGDPHCAVIELDWPEGAALINRPQGLE